MARSSERKTVRVSEQLEPVDTSIASVGPPGSKATWPPGLAARVAPVESMHRSILRQPVDQWQLETVRQRYQGLLDRETDPATRTALQTRLAHVSRQEALAKSARSFETALAESRNLDYEVAPSQQDSGDTKTVEHVTYDAEGLLQQSSRHVDGQKVFALIGSKGDTIAYLLMPPGLNAEANLSRRVGLRGSVRFDNSLRTNLISVRELDALSAPP